MSAPTPEDVARADREFAKRLLSLAGICRDAIEFCDQEVDLLADEIAKFRRAARAAAIEEAARDLEAFGDPAYYAEAIVAIRALGEESAAPREEATS